MANDLKQADSRVSYYIRRAIELNPDMREIVKIKPSGYKIEFPNHCIIEAIPVDPKGEAGGNDDGVFYSELWGAANKAALKLWTETTLSPTKFGQSFRWVETYAGYSGEAPLLEHLYEQGVKQGRKFDWTTEFEPELDAFENETGRMFCLWNTHPRRPWQSSRYYEQEAATLTPTEFDRVHKNQWVTSMSSFVPIEWWDNCRADMPPLDPEEPMIMSVDAAVSGDSFAVVCVSGRGNPLAPETDVRYARAWRPPKGGKIDFTAPEMEIRRLIAEFNIMELTYDEYQLADMAGRLKRELVVHMKPFPQGGARLKADKLLYDTIREKRVHHDGDYHLREHILNANSKEEGDNKMRIVKRSDEMKIDLCVALSMANDRCRYWRL